MFIPDLHAVVRDEGLLMAEGGFAVACVQYDPLPSTEVTVTLQSTQVGVPGNIQKAQGNAIIISSDNCSCS